MGARSRVVGGDEPRLARDDALLVVRAEARAHERVEGPVRMRPGAEPDAHEMLVFGNNPGKITMREVHLDGVVVVELRGRLDSHEELPFAVDARAPRDRASGSVRADDDVCFDSFFQAAMLELNAMSRMANEAMVKVIRRSGVGRELRDEAVELRAAHDDVLLREADLGLMASRRADAHLGDAVHDVVPLRNHLCYLAGKDAGALDGHSYGIVLLEDVHILSRPREMVREVGACWSRADNSYHGQNDGRRLLNVAPRVMTASDCRQKIYIPEMWRSSRGSLTSR